jgi:hypothetical protein
MTTTADAFEAGIDAVIATPTLNKGGFADAIRTVIDQSYTNSEATAWIDAIAVEYQRTGQINSATYSSFRSKINSDGKDLALIRFNALEQSISQLDETRNAAEAIELIDLRAERDEADANIDILIALKAGQPRQVREAIQLGIEQLRGYKQQVREQIQNLTGDPDS